MCDIEINIDRGPTTPQNNDVTNKTLVSTLSNEERQIKKICITHNLLTGYEIVVDDGYIKYIKFKNTYKGKTYRFILDISYELKEEVKEEIVDFYETRREDRIQEKTATIIQNIKINHIAKKKPYGYENGKDNPEAFSDIGLDNDKAITLIKKVLHNFHNIGQYGIKF